MESDGSSIEDMASSSDIDAFTDHDMRAEIDAEVGSPVIDCQITIQLEEPLNESFHAMDDPAMIRGQIVHMNGASVEDWTVELADSLGNVFTTTRASAEGGFSGSVLPLHTRSGRKGLMVRVVSPNGVCHEVVERSFYVCGRRIEEDFSVFPENWTLFGDAYWDDSGWLEMTDIQMGQAGAVYKRVF